MHSKSVDWLLYDREHWLLLGQWVKREARSIFDQNIEINLEIMETSNIQESAIDQVESWRKLHGT